MAEKQRFTKESVLILRVDTLFLLKKLIKPSFVDITSLNFFKLIIRKYVFFKQGQIRFPALVFLLSRNLLNYQSSLLNYENLALLPLNIDFYLSHNFLFNSNLLSLISSTITKDLAGKEKSQYGAIPYKSLIKSDSLSLNSKTHPSQYKSESAIKNQSIVFNNQLITGNRAEEDKNLYKIFPHIRTQFIFLKTSNIPITSMIKNPALSSSGTISGFLGLPHESHDKAYLLSKNKSWSDEEKPFDEKSSKIVFSKVKLFQSFPSTHISSDSDFKRQKSDIKAEKHRPVLAFKQATIRSNEYLDSDISTPNLLYLNPLRAELEDLKKTVTGMEKKEAEGESFTETMRSDKSHLSHKESDILDNKTNINLSYLADQIYQMLERKIEVEKERRGL